MVILGPEPKVLKSGRPPRPFDLGHIERDEHGIHGVVQLSPVDRIQVLATGGPPMAAVIPLDTDGFARLDAVYRLLAAIHGRRIPPDKRLTPQQRGRARHMLRAFDAARDGATQLDIARILFRTGALSRDEWQASSVRHAIKTLLRDARAMVAGGYRRLLRPRR